MEDKAFYLGQLLRSSLRMHILLIRTSSRVQLSIANVGGPRKRRDDASCSKLSTSSTPAMVSFSRLGSLLSVVRMESVPYSQSVWFNGPSL